MSGTELERDYYGSTARFYAEPSNLALVITTIAVSSYQSPTFLQIAAALKIKRGYEFEELCNDYFKARFPNLTPRINTNVRWTMSGTPDAFLFDESGQLIACQYGPQNNWHKKLHEDAELVAELAIREELTVRLLVFCTAAEIDLDEYALAQKEIRAKFGFSLDLCDLRRLADDLEKLYPGIAFRRLGIPIKIERFISLDSYLDSTNRRYWPKRRDLEEGRLYYPEKYIETIEKTLVNGGRCLLTGISGSGKTVLAIAFGITWRGNSSEDRKHPESVGFYLDASSGYSEQEGESWYQYIRTHDHQNEFFIIDNCHLSPLAVNAFCHQWERQKPTHALVILVSAPRTGSTWKVDWVTRDVQLAKEVRLAAKQIRNTEGRPVRMIVSLIGRHLDKTALLTGRELTAKMPLTVQALSELLETPLAFAIRSIRWAAGCYRREGIVPSISALAKCAGMTMKTTHKPQIRAVINEELESLRNASVVPKIKAA